jgi:hypothetical protein
MKELVLEPGEHQMVLEWTDADGKKQTKEETITIEKGKRRDFFFVGMVGYYSQQKSSYWTRPRDSQCR